jgi:hypothetical protein
LFPFLFFVYTDIFILELQRSKNTLSFIYGKRLYFNLSIKIPNNLIPKNNFRRTTMANSNLLKEAIADAKAVRETAIANAKIALEEAFTPKLQSMLSKKIEEDAEMEDEDTVEEQSDSSNVGAGDNKVNQADGSDEEKSETETSSDAPGAEGDDDTVVDKLTESEDEEEEITEEEEVEDEMATEESDEEDLDLEAIIRELEGEDEEVAEYEEMEDEAPVAEEEMEDEETTEVPTEEEDMADELTAETDEEDVDLDEIIKSLKEEDEDEEDITESEDEEGESEKVDELTERLKEAYTTIKSLKGTINEVNLLNAKLLFSNKLFKSHNLTEGQKMKIIETFDRAVSTREVKLVYTTLAESLTAGASKKTSLKEGFASKATKSTKPSPKAVIVEADQFTNRMKKLAGLQ